MTCGRFPKKKKSKGSENCKIYLSNVLAVIILHCVIICF